MDSASVLLTPGSPLPQSMTELPLPSTLSPALPLSQCRTLLRSLRPELPISLLWRPRSPVREGDVRLSPPSWPAARVLTAPTPFIHNAPAFAAYSPYTLGAYG